MSNKNKSLADKISKLLVTVPSTADPDDESVDDTNAKFTEPADDFDEKEEELLSSFRKQNVDLLADVDNRYAGRKSSRKTLHESDERDNEITEGSDDENEAEISHATESDESKQESLSDANDSDEYEDGSEEEDNGDDSDDGGHEEDGGISANENSDNYKHFQETDTSIHLKKGMCVRNQLSIWENLLEMRIQLQKSVLAANRMPSYEKHAAIKKATGLQFANKVKETKKSVENLLDKLLLLQQLVLKKYPETRKLTKVDSKQEKHELNDLDEEIPSDTDVSEHSENGDDDVESPVKKRKLADFENDISSVHRMYKNYRNGVIQKWHDKTRIVITKNNATSQSIINHIEHTLTDREKLLRKTQLKKGDYIIVGEEESKEGDENITEQYNKEIFDDNDFYHQLLRELIEVKSADLTDPVQLGRQWIQLQTLRSKMKRKIDTRATKGRKIRYAVHSKLVNFMAPIEENLWTDEAKTELYSSLFGQNK